MRKWVVAWVLLISIGVAWAANTSLSNLTAAGSVSGTDLLYDVQTAGSGGVKATVTQLATYLFGQVSGACTSASGGAFTCPGTQPSYSGGTGTWWQSCICTVGTGTGVSLNTIRLYPVMFTSSFTMTDLGARVTTAGTGTASLAIYKSTSTPPYRPTGTALASTAALDTSAASGCGGTCPGLIDGTFAGGSGSNVSITPGMYFLAMNTSVAGTVFTSINTGVTLGGYLMGSATQANVSSTATVANLTLAVSQTCCTWPDLTSASFTENTNSTYALLQFKAQ